MKKITRRLSVFAAVVFTTLSIQLNAQTTYDGFRHLDAERFTAAEKVFQQIATATPTTESYFNLGYAALRMPDASTSPELLAKAKEAFEKGSALNKNGDPMNLVGLGMIKYATKDIAGAKMAFDEAIKRTKGKNADIYHRIADAYTMFYPGINDPAEAVLNADKAIEVSKTKDNPDYYIAKANAYYIMNEGGDAMNALQNAERLSKNPARVYAKMGQIWLQGRNYKDSKEILDKAVAADPQHAPSYKYLSSFYQIYQQFDKAAESADNYMKNSDGDCGAKLRYAQLSFISKSFEKVLKTVDEIKDCNKNPIVNRLAGIAKYELGQPEDAIQLLTKYTQIAPKEEVYGLDYGYIGRSYLAIKDPAKRTENDSLGIIFVEKAIAMNDTTYDYYGKIAELFKERKDYKNAANFYEKVLTTKKNPDGGDYFNAAILYMQLRDYVKCDPYFDKVCELYKDSWPAAYYYSALAKTYKNTNPDEYPAAERYEKYLSLLNDTQKAENANKSSVSTAYKYLAGKALNADKDVLKAAEYLNSLLKVDPTNQDAIDLLQSVNSTTTGTTTAPGSGQ
jgi:tetratricopeptide (TPR) repeat protein